MELILTHTGRLNFTQLARCGRSCESRFRQNFRKSFDWFWSGCAAAMKKGLEILGISIVDADAKDSVFLKAEQTFTDKKRGRKPDCTKEMKDPDSLTGWYLRMRTAFSVSPQNLWILRCCFIHLKNSSIFLLLL